MKPWIRSRIRIRIDLKCWIRIRIETNADLKHCPEYVIKAGLMTVSSECTVPTELQYVKTPSSSKDIY
jgi:hypothetical protein